MSQENVEIVRASFRGVSSWWSDFGAELWALDVEWTPPTS